MEQAAQLDRRPCVLWETRLQCPDHLRTSSAHRRWEKMFTATKAGALQSISLTIALPFPFRCFFSMFVPLVNFLCALLFGNDVEGND